MTVVYFSNFSCTTKFNYSASTGLITCTNNSKKKSKRESDNRQQHMSNTPVSPILCLVVKSSAINFYLYFVGSAV